MDSGRPSAICSFRDVPLTREPRKSGPTPCPPGHGRSCGGKRVPREPRGYAERSPAPLVPAKKSTGSLRSDPIAGRQAGREPVAVTSRLGTSLVKEPFERPQRRASTTYGCLPRIPRASWLTFPIPRAGGGVASVFEFAYNRLNASGWQALRRQVSTHRACGGGLLPSSTGTERSGKAGLRLRLGFPGGKGSSSAPREAFPEGNEAGEVGKGTLPPENEPSCPRNGAFPF